MSDWLTGNERVHLAYPTRINVGEFFEHKGEIVKALTVQTDCPRIGSNRPFVMFLVVNADGVVFPADDVCGLKRVWRKV